MSNELGWHSKFDEGIRLLAKSSNFSGIRVNLLTPGEYDCPAAEAYFNFYLGFNQNAGRLPGRQIETGVSFSTKGWQAFINNHGRETASAKINVGKGELLRLELVLSGKIIQLRVNSLTLASAFNLSSAAPKMIVALHESHGNLKDRKVWFDKAQMTCTEVKIANVWKNSAGKIAFEFNHIDRKLINAAPSHYALTATMKKPSSV